MIKEQDVLFNESSPAVHLIMDRHISYIHSRHRQSFNYLEL